MQKEMKEAMDAVRVRDGLDFVNGGALRTSREHLSRTGVAQHLDGIFVHLRCSSITNYRNFISLPHTAIPRYVLWCFAVAAHTVPLPQLRLAVPVGHPPP